MIDIIGWIITLNTLIISFTCYRCCSMRYTFLNDCLDWEKSQAFAFDTEVN